MDFQFYEVIVVALLAFWIYTIIKVANSRFEGGKKVFWLSLVVLMVVVGAVLFWLFGRNDVIKRQYF